MKRPLISDELFRELIHTAPYGGAGRAYYFQKIGPYTLTAEQWDKLIDYVRNSHSSSWEKAMSDESVAALEELRNRKY